MYDVITVGSCTVDAFARTRFSELIKIMKPDGERDLLAYPTGAKVLIEELKFSTGGGGTNTAVCLSRLGHKVAYLGRMGDDENGEFIINRMKKEKVDMLVSRGKGHSGYSMILDSLEHDRTILAYKGENNNLKYKDVPLKKLKTKWFYFSSMMEKSLVSMNKLAEFASKKKIKIAFNASSYLCKQGAEVMKKILENTEIFVLNDEEAKILVGEGKLEELFKRVRELGPKIVVITLGGKGSAVYDGKFMYIANTNKVKPVETTGAGDAFASTFLSGYIRKGDIKYAIKLGTVNAESVISHHGAKNKLLKRKEAEAALRKAKIKVKKKKI